jgi:hypothetical protein
MGFVSFYDDRTGLLACDDCGRFMIEGNRLSESAWVDTDPAELAAQFLARNDAVRTAIRAGWDWWAQQGEAPIWARWRCPECLAAASHRRVATR